MNFREHAFFASTPNSCSGSERHLRRISALHWGVPVVAVTTSWKLETTAIFADHWSFWCGGSGSQVSSCAFPLLFRFSTPSSTIRV